MDTFSSDSSVASDPAWAVEWIELPRGLSLSSLGSSRTLRGWSRSPRPSSVDSQDLPEVLGLCCACMCVCVPGAGFTFRVRVIPSPFLPHHPASDSFSCKRRRYPAGRPRAGLLCSAWFQRAGLLAPSVLTSAHPRPYPRRPCCMVMGCHGDIHLFSGPGPQLRGASPCMDGSGWGKRGKGGRASQETPGRFSFPQAWPEAIGANLEALSARY